MTKARKKKTPPSLVELSTLDDFLKEEGKFEEFQSIAIKEVLAWQAAQSVKGRRKRRSFETRPRGRSSEPVNL